VPDAYFVLINFSGFNMNFALVFWAFIFLIPPALCGAAENASAIIFKAMGDEMQRSMNRLQIDKFPRPYFINYQIRHHHRVQVMASLGALLDSIANEKRTLFVNVRVGEPVFDSSTPESHKRGVEQFIPLDNKLLSLKHAIWRETDLRYKQAVMNLLKKQGRVFSGVEKHEWSDFAKGNSPVVQINKVPSIAIDIQKWKNLARKVSASFQEVPELGKSRVKIIFDQTIRYYLDTDGNKIQDVTQLYRVVMDAWMKNPSGVQLHDQEFIYFTEPKEFPSDQELMRKAKNLMKSMIALKTAPKAEPHVGPVIFSPEATAILFHEALGHRLEGDRLRKTSDGKTFLKKLGTPILPDFLSIVDDPTLQKFNNQNLIGYYQFDDEGQKGEKTILVEQGILKNFLLSRAPVLKFKKSNGHARSDGIRAPMSRMSTFIVRSDNTLSKDQLKQRLIDEIKRQNKPYGFIVNKMISGETFTEGRDIQVFKGRPLYVSKVFPEDGREEIVRGVEFLGTPLSMVNKIIVTGEDVEVVSGFCGAESGDIPVTTIAPSVLLSEVELQTSHDISLRLPILPPPVPEPGTH